jgi:hypothetical protein
MSATLTDGALHDAVTDLPPIALADAVDVAALQRRFDHKFLVEAARLPALLEQLPGMRALEVDGRRATSYTSIYLDTPDLRSYRDHVQRRRRRWKIRTRDYGDGAIPMLELKLKGHRGQTIKERWPHPDPERLVLGPRGRVLVGDALRTHYGFGLPDELRHSVTTRYTRITLVDAAAGERITIDLGLQVDLHGQRLLLGTDDAVVETKSPYRRGQAVEALQALGQRPQRLSKYCVGVAASHGDLRGNPWMPALRRLSPGAVTVGV